MLIKQIGDISNSKSYSKTTAIKKDITKGMEVLKDRLEISTEARDRIAKDEIIGKCNDERINEIKNAIANGTYKIDSRKLAESMLQSMKE